MFGCMPCRESYMLMWELDPRRLGFRGSRRGIAVSGALAGVTGDVLGVLWLVGVGEWLGGEVRSGRSQITCVRDARICCRTPSRDLLRRSRLCPELTNFAGNRVWAPEVGCRGVVWVVLWGVA